MAVQVASDHPMIIDGVGVESTSVPGSRSTARRRGARRSGPGRDRGRCRSGRGRRPGRVPGRALVADGAARTGSPTMNRLADLCDSDADELARLETLQTGTAYKLRRESDFAFASDNLRFFAGQIRHLEGKAAYEYTGSHTSFVRREPIGVVGQVAPVELPVLDGDLEDRAGARGRATRSSSSPPARRR